MQGAGCYYIPCKNTCVCEVNKLERRFYLVDAEVLPEVFLKVVKAKELLASGEVRSISAATRSVDLSRSAFYKYKDCIFDSENGREVVTVMATLRDETGALQSLLAGISAAGASIVTINQSTPENGAALVAVTIRTDTMQMTPEELTERLSRQRMVWVCTAGITCKGTKTVRKQERGLNYGKDRDFRLWHGGQRRVRGAVPQCRRCFPPGR